MSHIEIAGTSIRSREGLFFGDMNITPIFLVQVISMDTPEKINGLVNLTTGLIRNQLTLASRTPRQALKDHWALGYCWGMFDAARRMPRMD